MSDSEKQLGMPPKCPLAQHKKCENNLMCGWCDGVSHYKNTSEEAAAKRAQKQEKKAKRTTGIPTYVKGGKEGMDLEKRVAKRWNDGMSTKGPKKKNSNIKLRPSLLEEMEAEATEEPSSREPMIPSLQRQKPKKETIRPRLGTSRTNEARRQPNSGAMWFAKGDILLDHALMEVKERGTKNARGEKTISIPKEWLTKQAEEAFQEGREFWYLAFAYKNDDEVYVIKTLDHEIELMKELRKLTEENALLQEKLKEQESS